MPLLHHVGLLSYDCLRNLNVYTPSNETNHPDTTSWLKNLSMVFSTPSAVLPITRRRNTAMVLRTPSSYVSTRLSPCDTIRIPFHDECAEVDLRPFAYYPDLGTFEDATRLPLGKIVMPGRCIRGVESRIFWAMVGATSIPKSTRDGPTAPVIRNAFLYSLY
ncbi:aryl-alcohol oxidase [Moniliophthora roreri]|nr:aryl-alcohol oxidase [Moniliophthora roreri]